VQADILVAGGGFAGVYAALSARRECCEAGRDDLTVLLVNRDAFLTLRPRLYEADPGAFRTPLAPTLDGAGVRFEMGTIASLDVTGRSCSLVGGEAISWQRLVLATGSRVRELRLPGAERLLDIDTWAGAMRVGERLGELARALRDDAHARATVVVAGAGFTGIEFATELRVRLDAAGVGARTAILLIDRAPVVGAELGAGPRPQIERALADARVEFLPAVHLAAIGSRDVALDDGRRFPADLVVNCTGMVANELTAEFGGGRDRLGRLEVDDTLRVIAAPMVFAAGDVAAARVDAAGQASLMSCQHALTMGRYAGYNAARDLLAMPLQPYRQERYVTCLDLGASGAVLTQGWDRQVAMTGEAAKAVKRRINGELIYPPLGTATELLAAAKLPESDVRGGSGDRTPGVN
jgi:NADH dehydrogenase